MDLGILFLIIFMVCVIRQYRIYTGGLYKGDYDKKDEEENQ